MSANAVDLVVIRFPGNRFSGDILPEIQRVVDAGIVRVIDVLIAIRMGDEPVRVVEIAELEDEALRRFQPVAADVSRMLTDQDAYALSEGLGPDSSVALILFEHIWAAPITDAIDAAGGELLMSERIPRAVVQQLRDEAAQQIV